MVIDAHIHFTMPLSAGVDEARRAMGEELELIAEAGVDGATGSLIDPLYSNCDAHSQYNDFFAETSKGFEGRFWPWCVVNPVNHDAADEVRRCYEVLGMKALKLHPWLQGFSCSDDYCNPVFEVCAELGMPINLHDGSPPYASTPACGEVARRYPEAKVVLAHAGLNDQWRQARDLACELPNVYLTMSGPSMLAMQSIVDSVPAERLMYGSDYGAGGVSLIHYRLHKIQQLEMDDRTRKMVLGETALRLLGAK